MTAGIKTVLHTTPMSTRLLRLWHWRRAMSSRQTARQYDPKDGAYSTFRAKNANRTADFHIKAVQVLNDCLDCRDTTAEQDDLTFPKPHSTRKR